MTLTAEKQMEHIGETRGCADQDHDVVHELSKRLDALWRYDQYMANAEGKAELQKFWRELKGPEQQSVDQFKKLIVEEVQNNCF